MSISTYSLHTQPPLRLSNVLSNKYLYLLFIRRRSRQTQLNGRGCKSSKHCPLHEHDLIACLCRYQDFLPTECEHKPIERSEEAMPVGTSASEVANDKPDTTKHIAIKSARLGLNALRLTPHPIRCVLRSHFTMNVALAEC